jgi:hypothetical protein
MNTRMKAVGIVLALTVVTSGATAVWAQGRGGQQDGGRGDRPRIELVEDLFGVVETATGLSQAEVMLQLSQGATLADVISQNGGDVQAVTDEMTAIAIERVNTAVASGEIQQARADQLVENIPSRIDELLNGEFRERGGRGEGRGDRGDMRGQGERFLVEAAATATGLEPRDLLSELRDGGTMADVIVANGGDVQSVINIAIASATQRINAAVAEGRMTQEEADSLLSEVPARYESLLNTDWAERAVEVGGAMGVIRLAAEQTGLDARTIREQLQGGASLAQVLTDNGVEVDAFIDDAVARLEARLNVRVVDGRMTQEEADALVSSFRSQLTERINQVQPAGASL